MKTIALLFLGLIVLNGGLFCQTTPTLDTKAFPPEMTASMEKYGSKETDLAGLKTKIGKPSKVNFKFSNMPLSEFLSMFISEFKLNIINDAGESGKRLSFAMTDMHPADIFDTLLRSYGVDWYIKNEVIRIVRLEQVRVYKLNFANVTDVLKSLGGVAGNEGISMLQWNNAILAKGEEGKLDQLGKILRELDCVPKQVLIEAHFIETSLDFNNLIGTDLGFPFKNAGQNNYVQTAGFTKFEKAESPEGVFYRVLTSGSNALLAKIEALKTKSDAKILANPKLLVTNHNTAKILAGERLGFKTVTQTQTAAIETIQFLEIGIKLFFTPHISENGEILMNIKPVVSEGRIDEKELPRETTTETETQVVVKDGGTIVIGGLVQKKKTETARGVPILSDIPFLNTFFQNSKTGETTRQIIILITPKIIPMEETVNVKEFYDE